MTGGRVMHGSYAPVRTVGPTEAPVTLTEAKANCVVEDSDDDDLITALIDAATAHLDGWSGVLGRALVSQTWEQAFDGFSVQMRLPLGPVASISAVTYYDADNALQTLGAETYELLSDALGPFVALKDGEEFPATYARAASVKVTYIAGEDADDVPRPLKQAILLLVGHWYANREAVAPGDMRELPLAVSALTKPYCRLGV